jgi:hypothetical protein
MFLGELVDPEAETTFEASDHDLALLPPIVK